MPIDPDIKKELDRKYALGDITEDEYRKRISVLEEVSRKSSESRYYEYENEGDSLEDAPTVQQNGADLSNAPTIIQDNNEIDDLSNAPTIISPDGVEHFVDESDVERNTEEFINRYEFQSNIGAGGMGEVSLYKDIKLNRLVAVKRLRKETTGFSEQANRRFKAEAQTIAGLNHQNIVSVYDIGEDKEGLFIIMEYVEGTDLSKYIKEKEKLPVEEALKLIRQVAQALNYAHRRKIFHRDIKPANILLNEESIPKIVDFGLAKAGGDTSYSMTGFGMGTMAYAAPEQKRDAKNVDHRADIYALGATLYELVTGSNPSVIKESNIPPQLKSLILKCVEEKPENRYFSIDEVLSQIDKITGAGIKIQQQKKSFGEAGVCPQCSTENSKEVKFCQNCGTGLYEKCEKCGFENGVWVKNCGGCGINLEDYKKYLDHVSKGNEYYWKKKYSRAIKEYKLGLEIYLDETEIKKQLKESEKKYAEVKELREKAKKLFDHKNLSQALSTVNELISKEAPSEETANFKKQIEDSISKANDLIKSAETEKKKGNYNEGLKLIKEAKSIDISNTNIQRQKENILKCVEMEKSFEKLYSDKKYDEALQLIKKLNNQSTENQSIQKKYEEVSDLNNELNEYENNINKAINDKDLKSAKLELQKALNISPNINQINNLNHKITKLYNIINELYKKAKLSFENNNNIIESLKICEEAYKIDKTNKLLNELYQNNLNNKLNICINEKDYFEALITVIKLKKFKQVNENLLIEYSNKLKNIWKKRKTKFYLNDKTKKQLNYLKDRGSIIKIIIDYPEITNYLSFLKLPSKKEISNLIKIIKSIIDDMIFVQAGTFIMEGKKYQNQVTISRDYYIGKYPVTQAQWQAIMGSNPSHFNFEGTNRPVERVSWNDCKQFINILNTLLMKFRDFGLASNMGFRFPREIEWEFAVRGGNKSKGYVYSGSDNIDEVAWYSSNSVRETHPVGQKKPNELGIYDMSGNVWEWCEDWYNEFPKLSDIYPKGVLTGIDRVLRGGSWNCEARDCQVDYRYWTEPSYRYYFIGFRLVLSDLRKKLKESQTQSIDLDIKSNKRSIIVIFRYLFLVAILISIINMGHITGLSILIFIFGIIGHYMISKYMK